MCTRVASQRPGTRRTAYCSAGLTRSTVTPLPSPGSCITRCVGAGIAARLHFRCRATDVSATLCAACSVRIIRRRQHHRARATNGCIPRLTAPRCALLGRLPRSAVTRAALPGRSHRSLWRRRPLKGHHLLSVSSSLSLSQRRTAPDSTGQYRVAPRTSTDSTGQPQTAPNRTEPHRPALDGIFFSFRFLVSLPLSLSFAAPTPS